MSFPVSTGQDAIRECRASGKDWLADDEDDEDFTCSCQPEACEGCCQDISPQPQPSAAERQNSSSSDIVFFDERSDVP